MAKKVEGYIKLCGCARWAMMSEQQSDKSKTASSDPHSQSTTKSKRRAGRSAVPSWDEILFGD